MWQFIGFSFVVIRAVAFLGDVYVRERPNYRVVLLCKPEVENNFDSIQFALFDHRNEIFESKSFNLLKMNVAYASASHLISKFIPEFKTKPNHFQIELFIVTFHTVN